MTEEERLRRLAKDIQEGRLAPVYLFEGPDEYRKRRALDALKKAIVGDAPPDMALDDAGAAPAREVCERARTAPFFVERRLITASGAEKYGDADVSALAAYAADPSPAAVLVFAADGHLDRRKKTFKFFDGLEAVYTFAYLSGEARRARIAAEATRLGVALSPEGLAFLDYALAPDLFTVVRELEKLATYAGGRELAAAEVKTVAATSRVESAYDMVREVGEGRAGEALTSIRRLLLAGERPESLVGLLARQVRLIWLAKELQASGATRGQIAARLGVAPYFVGEYMDAGARLSGERLSALHRLLAELDRGLKVGRYPPELALEVFAARAGA